jgi:hypothetical protein
MILLDHCVPQRYLRLVREWGYTATPMSDYIPADSPDSDVLSLATRLDAVLLTIDLDFGSILDYPPVEYGGIIVMRYQVKDESALDSTLHSLLTDLYRDNLRGILVVVTTGRYRVRK